MEVNTRLKYNTNFAIEDAEWEMFITSEIRAYQAKYADPLALNFKLMVDFDKPYGLFADEKNIDSALAYLKRIGDNVRYSMLKHWIEIFKIFIRDYDFLILTCEGIDTIVNAKPHEAFGDDDKLTISVRETSDMLCQSLLTQYRHIWYDDNRGVEVLPANLRRFDLFVLIYSAGYFNMSLYDVNNTNTLSYEKDVETKIFPTLKKLSDKGFVEKGEYKFNHHLVSILDASFNNEESGKSFFGTLSNEPGSSDIIKNTIVFNYRFANFKGIFSNLFGDFDFSKTLALMAAQNKFTNEISASLDNLTEKSDELLTVFEDTKDESKKNSKLKTEFLKRITKYKQALLGKGTPIGNAIRDLTNPEYYKSMVKDAVNQFITNIEDKYIYSNIAKLNNLIMSNFPSDFGDIYGRLNEINISNPLLNISNQKFDTDQINPTVNKNINVNRLAIGEKAPNSIQLESKDNSIYTRKTF